jgi:hypothetical protein
MAKEILTLIGIVLPALIAIPKAMYEYRQVRLRVSAAPDGNTQTLTLSLQTTPPEPMLTAEFWRKLRWEQLKIVTACVVLAGAYSFFVYDAFKHDEAILWRVLLTLAAVAYALPAAWTGMRLWSIRRRDDDRPHYAAAAGLTVQAGFPTLIRRCQDALVGIGAVRSQGTRTAVSGDQYAKLEGGTGRWPEGYRGQKVMIEIGASNPNVWSVTIISATYVPDPFQTRRDASNVTRILQLLA